MTSNLPPDPLSVVAPALIDEKTEAGKTQRVRKPLDESWLLFLMASVQFINVLDFMMVMPLGPDFASALDIPKAHLGYIGGSYTASAMFAGLLGALLLDRFDRRRALLFCLVGLSFATISGAFATGLYSLMGARVLAGLFGGPATSLMLSIVSDVIPPQRRGKAIGVISGAFSIASVFGVPVGLELSRLGGWSAPFYGVGAVGLLISMMVMTKLPPMRSHMLSFRAQEDARKIFISRWLDRRYLLPAGITFILVSGTFTLVPNLSAYLQFNVGFPRERLGLLYLVGGALAFFSVRAAGRWVDRFGAGRIVWLSSSFLILDLFVGFAFPRPLVPVLLFFAGFMVPNAIRNVAVNTLVSKIPKPEERARFQSQQSAVQHLAATIGAFVGSVVLSEAPNGDLIGMHKLAFLTIFLTLAVPLIARAIERRTDAQSY